MFGGISTQARSILGSAFASFILLGVTPVFAADLGGDCCADLEERVAELEATTARKGNRKVSLTVSGFVNEAVLFWDDGRKSNAYVVTNETAQDRVRFLGQAQISKDWTAGYLLELGLRGAREDRQTNKDNEAMEKRGGHGKRRSAGAGRRDRRLRPPPKG